MNPLNAFRNYGGRNDVSLHHHHQRVTKPPIFLNAHVQTNMHSLTHSRDHTFKFTENDKNIKLNFLAWY